MSDHNRLYFNAISSKSRMSIAICARFAASATSVKSFRNGSVDDFLLEGFGAGGTILLLVGDCWVDDMVDVDVDVVERKSILGSVYGCW